MSYLPDHHPLTADYNAMMKQIDRGHIPHPMEIWELAEQLRAEGAISWADRLCRHLPDKMD